MKKITTLLFIIFISLSQAQFTLTNNDTGNPINDGDIITVDTAYETTHIIAKNVSSNDIYLSMEVVNITNTDGTEMTYCFGVGNGGACYPRMTVGERRDGGDSLAPNAETGPSQIDFTHKDDHTDVFPNYPKDYELKFFATDTNGGSQIGNAITFTYRFAPNTGILDDFKKIGFEYKLLNKKLYLFSQNKINIGIYDITGKNIYQKKIVNNNIVDLSTYQNGIYILYIQFKNKKYYKKFILK